MRTIDLINPSAKYRDKLYSRWEQIRDRCNNPSHPSYKDYGGRGIKVCDEWNCTKYGFVAFYAWAMQNGFESKLSIERMDVDGNYEPSNCRWIPLADQVHNRRCSIRIWDNDRYISMKTYCNIHLDTNPYQNCLRWVREKGIPPYIAMYHNFDCYVTDWWLYSHKEDLLDIMLDIISAHPNLIDNKDISIERWADNYLLQNCKFYQSQIQKSHIIDKIWDIDKYINIKDYCKKYDDTQLYDIVLKRIEVGIIPQIALYYPCRLSKEQYSCMDLEFVLTGILNNHPNLIETNKIPLKDYVKKYLEQYNTCNYKLWGDRLL